MAYRIEINCVGCTICAQKCPTKAITGRSKQRHVIEPLLCIDCGVCASYCPVEDCIFDACGFAAAKIKPNARPIAVVDRDLCTGCGDCMDICPCDCLTQQADGDGVFFPYSFMAHPKACTACRECEYVCGDKRAILIRWPDGSYCPSLDQLPAGLVASRKAGAAVTR
jgi:NAD-dependent dihydropyrimidine dehydrogenase PreA subunit